MPAPADAKRAHEEVEGSKNPPPKRERSSGDIDEVDGNLPDGLSISTQLFYYILTKNDLGHHDVKEISQPNPKDKLEFECAAHAIEGLKVPTLEEDGQLNLKADFEKDIKWWRPINKV